MALSEGPAGVSPYTAAEPRAEFGWGAAIGSLFRLHQPPARWWRAAGWILLCNAVLIVLCIVVGKVFVGDAKAMFGERRPGTFASVAVLVCSGVACFKIRGRVRGLPIAQFWLAFGILMCIAGADDLLRLHEQTDRAFHRLTGLNPRDKITDHLDDAIVAAYVLPAMWFAFRHRKALFAVPLTIQILGVAFVMFALHLVIDVLGWSAVLEESMKQTAGCIIWLAMLATLFQPTLPGSWMMGTAAEA